MVALDLDAKDPSFHGENDLPLQSGLTFKVTTL